VGEKPTRLSLQPEAIGAVMEVTKWLEPLMQRVILDDPASVQDQSAKGAILDAPVKSSLMAAEMLASNKMAS